MQSRTLGRRSASAAMSSTRPPEPRLEDDADVVVAVLAQLAVEPQRVVGRRRVLHVDAHEVAVPAAVRTTSRRFSRQSVVRQPEPERGRLDADVRVERRVVDRREHAAVRLRDRARLLLARDLLAEDVDRRHLPAGVEVAHDGDGLLERRAGDVARREVLDDRLRHRRQETNDGGIEQRHGCSDSRWERTSALA